MIKNIKSKDDLLNDELLAAQEDIRKIRDKLLSETDLLVLKAYESGVPVSDEVKEYRQTLRDLPTSKYFPHIKSGKVVVPKLPKSV